jgi:hypothetical protein
MPRPVETAQLARLAPISTRCAGFAWHRDREPWRVMRQNNAWYGCRRDTKDARDHMFKPMAIRMPAAVDLRAHCPP